MPIEKSTGFMQCDLNFTVMEFLPSLLQVFLSPAVIREFPSMGGCFIRVLCVGRVWGVLKVYSVLLVVERTIDLSALNNN